MQEEKICSSAHFITLTYDSKYVPIVSPGLMDLSKRDIQLFFKRLRKRHKNQEKPIKYYAVGEYGGKTFRPHYHIILFNANIEKIQAAWQMGHVYYGNVSGASVGYTLKYMSKNRKSLKKFLYPRIPEFSLMSKGLGISYLSETMCNWHIGDLVNRMYCGLPGGIKIAMPRYYKDKLYLENERSLISEVFSQKAHEQKIDKITKQTFREMRNEMAAIDASFDRMYFSAQKTKI